MSRHGSTHFTCKIRKFVCVHKRAWRYVFSLTRLTLPNTLEQLRAHEQTTDARMLQLTDAACTRDSHVDHTEAVGPGAGVSRLSSSAEGVVGVFEAAQVGGLTASDCRLA